MRVGPGTNYGQGREFGFAQRIPLARQANADHPGGPTGRSACALVSAPVHDREGRDGCYADLAGTTWYA
jgi:hypothetical protein